MTIQGKEYKYVLYDNTTDCVVYDGLDGKICHIICEGIKKLHHSLSIDLVRTEQPHSHETLQNRNSPYKGK